VDAQREDIMASFTPLGKAEILDHSVANASLFAAPSELAEARDVREAIHALARQAGYRDVTLLECRADDAPGETASGLVPLYYAVLLTRGRDDDVRIAVGESQVAALSDLLWTLGAPLLFEALARDDEEPDWADEGMGLVRAPSVLH
jgi:hypothetical protein